MREILFRGKQIDNGEWAYGSLVHRTEFYGDPCDYYLILTGGEFHCDYYTAEEVHSKTVGQFTGLTDKNGKKIFEGDIVDCWSEGVNAKGTVQQRKDGMWIIYPAWQKIIMWGLCPDEYCHTTVEVIGNIHDNPELLGGAEDGY